MYDDVENIQKLITSIKKVKITEEDKIRIIKWLDELIDFKLNFC